MSWAALRRAILAGALLVLLCPAGAWAARPLELGFSDSAYTGPDAASWLQRSAQAGADMVRIDIGWDAPDTAIRPAGFDARNPADPHYNFTAADAAIREASAIGLRVLVLINGAPLWAEGPGRPADVPQGTWRPNPAALEDYAVALGLRYSGHFPDPANPGHMLPRVAAFQVWNEPNLSEYLNPQWSGTSAAAPTIYRAMLNSFYRGVKSVDPQALVVTAGTAPFGDPQIGGQRIQPALFWRDVLCVKSTPNGGLAGTGCSDPAHFDVLAHHPYSWGSPLTHALWPDDVAVPDLGKLTRILRVAERTGGALPRIHHPVWVTEIGYNSQPPNPAGVPIAEQARWLEQSFAELWREGVSAVFWYEVGDAPDDPSSTGATQSGVYYVDGQPKPALTAFRFPLVAWRGTGPAVDVWGRTPAGGRLVIEQLVGSAWKAVRTLRERAQATFLTEITARGTAILRAQIAGQNSLDWRLG
ncbi:MAG: hypothetical protein ABSG43_21350 [Solirubrobacteraceae bacterium]